MVQGGAWAQDLPPHDAAKYAHNRQGYSMAMQIGAGWSFGPGWYVGTAPVVVTDPYFNQVSLLLHGDGTAGAQNNTFLDSSTNNFTVTRNGNTTQGTLTPFSQTAGAWSNYFNGTTDSLQITNTTAMNYGTGSFTLEFWTYLNSTSVATFVHGSTTTSGNLGVQLQSGTFYLYAVGGGYVSYSFTPTANTWYHLAFVRNGSSSTTFYVNGVAVSTQAFTQNITGVTGSTVIGVASNSPAGYVNGYISNLRATNTAVYTTNFTPPTTSLTSVSGTTYLLCQSNYFVDNSGNNFTVTAAGTPSAQPFSPFAPTAAYSTGANGGSMYFDGTGDYLNLATNTAYNFGTGDFTIEAWIYCSSTGTQAILDTRTTDALQAYIFYTGSQKIAFIYSASSVTSASTYSLNTWNHVAVTRASGTIRLFINGVLDANTATYSSAIDASAFPSIGGGRSTGASIVNGYYYNGYISNLRVVKGTAVYTATFTPPTAPLTAITNTSLLLSGTNAGILDNAIKNNLETVGSAQVSTGVVKYGTGSMSFNGTTDYLYVPFTPQYIFGTSNWTVEFWVNATSIANGPTFLELNSENTGGFGSIRIAVSSGGAIYLLCSTGGAWINTSTTAAGAMTTGSWYHIAAVRNGSTFTLYVNGTSGLTYSSASALSNAGTYSFIGCDYSSNTPQSLFSGYIDDLRITEGVARYTANFTPPTQAFPNQ